MPGLRRTVIATRGWTSRWVGCRPFRPQRDELRAGELSTALPGCRHVGQPSAGAARSPLVAG